MTTTTGDYDDGRLATNASEERVSIATVVVNHTVCRVRHKYWRLGTEYGQRDRVVDRGHGVGRPASVIALVRQPYALDEHRAAIFVLVRDG